MSKITLTARVIEHGFNDQADWAVNRNDTVEAIIRVGQLPEGEVVFTLPDKNGRYELIMDKKDLLELLKT